MKSAAYMSIFVVAEFPFYIVYLVPALSRAAFSCDCTILWCVWVCACVHASGAAVMHGDQANYPYQVPCDLELLKHKHWRAAV